MSDNLNSNVVPDGSDAEYIPGSCNIGIREVRRRQLVGGIGLFLTISTILGLYRQHGTYLARLGVFLPAVVMSMGYLQGRKKFCLAFGLSGLFNFGKLGSPKRVISEVDRKIDREAAIKLMLQAVGLAALVTAFVFLLPIPTK
ncbi:MAG: hypothetical protein WCO95_01850 [Actinomycetes bacterium]